MKSSLRDSALGVEPTYDSLSLPLSAPLPPLGKREKKKQLGTLSPTLDPLGSGRGARNVVNDLLCLCDEASRKIPEV